MRKPFEIHSFNELELSGYVWQRTDEDSHMKGVVVISHGMAETIERYDAFASYLTENGYVVYGINQRGHGPNAPMLGYLGDDGWHKMKEDLKQVVQSAKTEHSDKPMFVIGHSMGSFLTRDFLLDYSQLVDGAVLSGTGDYSKIELQLGQWLSKRDQKKFGDKHISPFIDNLVFSKNNKRIDAVRTSFDWLSRDEQKVREYIEDPCCGKPHPSSFFYQFFSALKRILYEDDFRNLKVKLPLFILSGDMDPVGNYGKGVEKTAERYKIAGFETQMKLYKDGRHEILNELNRGEVYRDIVAWLDTQI